MLTELDTFSIAFWEVDVFHIASLFNSTSNIFHLKALAWGNKQPNLTHHSFTGLKPKTKIVKNKNDTKEKKTALKVMSISINSTGLTFALSKHIKSGLIISFFTVSPGNTHINYSSCFLLWGHFEPFPFLPWLVTWYVWNLQAVAQRVKPL